MLRKALFATVTSLGLLSPLAIASPVDAHEYYHHHHHCYHVYYRSCGFEPWRRAGEFESRHRAFHVADEFRDRGFEVYIR